MRVRWSSAPIRMRLTAWYAAAMALMLLAYAAATFVAVQHEFVEQLDDQLRDDFESAESLLRPAANGGVTWSATPARDPDDEEARGTELWAKGGEALYRSGVSEDLPRPSWTSDFRAASIDVRGRPWRTLSGPADVAGRSVVLRVSRSEERVRAQTWEVLVVLVLGLPLAVGLAGVAGYALAKRGLTPLGQLASATRRISADRLHERLTVPNATDEIGELAAVINDTLARLELSFDQLRRFTADASHELRTPLSVIRGIGEMGLADMRTPEEYRDAMGSMLEEVDRLTTLVDTLLRLSRGDAGTARLACESIDLGQLARDVAASLAILADERQQRVSVDVDDDLRVVGDRSILREALTNVLDNAIRHSPLATPIRLRVHADRDQAILTVEDEGPGIPAEYRDRVFDRFFRLEEARSRDSGGTGLGLAIAKWAVEASGGRISIEGGDGGGTLARIVLTRTEGTNRPPGHRRQQEGNP